VSLLKLVRLYFRKIECHLNIHTSLTISIHRNITAITKDP
jgi:hypothetical protein